MKVAYLILLSLWVVGPVAYFLIRKIRHYPIGIQYLDYARETEKGHNIIIRFTPKRWPPFFFDTWLTPRFEVTVENLGIPIDFGHIFFKRSFYSDVSAAAPDNFSDLMHGTFYSKTLENFEKGKTINFALSLDSKYIESNRLYRLEATFTKGIPCESGGHNLVPLLHFQTSEAFRVHPFSTLIAIIGVYAGVLLAILTRIF